MGNLLRFAVILVVIIGFLIFVLGKFPNLVRSTPQEGNKGFFSFQNFLNPSKNPPSGSSTFGISPFFQAPPSANVGGGAPSGFSGLINFFSGLTQGYSIPQGYNQSQVSPYYGKVKLGSVAETLIQITSALPGLETADISGWHVKARNTDVTIPQAINNYNPSIDNSEQDIVISGSVSVNLYKGTTPIGKNLRLNKCTGYLENNAHFNPSLPRSCPAPFTWDEVRNLAGFCQNTLMSIGSCVVPSPQTINSLPGTDDGNACRQFLQTVSAFSCYEAHSHEVDFLSNTWMLWTGQKITLDPYHDEIKLLDKNGLLVDYRAY